jgi:hypothetical protein
MTERLLSLALPDDETVDGSALHWLRMLLLIHAAVRAWAWLHAVLQSGPFFYFIDEALVASLLTVTAVLGLFRRTGRVAAMVALLPAFGLVLKTMPSTENHVLLELVVLVLFAWLDPRKNEDARLLVIGVRWVSAIVLFYTGLQKALGGLYFRGEFLAWAMKGSSGFAGFFRHFLSERELDRILMLDTVGDGAGPYRVSSPLLLVLSNLVWIAEMVLPALLFHRATRLAAALASIAMVLTFQIAARELVFAALFSMLAVAWIPGPWHRRLAPVWLTLYALILAHISGWLHLPLMARLDGSI